MNLPKKDDYTVRAFLVATDMRDMKAFPNPSEFYYELPVTLANVEGVSIRDYKFRQEMIVNRNNNVMRVAGVKGNVPFNITITLTPGDYGNNISTLLTHINNKLSDAGILYLAWSVNDVSTKVRLTASTFAPNDYVCFYASRIFDVLGLSLSTNLCLFHTTKPAAFSDSSTIFHNVATTTIYEAPNTYDMWTTSDMVVRITNVEAILAPSGAVNRATAVLFSSGDNGTNSKQCLDHFMPLLQPQSRLQRIIVRLVNMNGDLYDTPNAVFLIRFYCRDSASLPP
jgi:hypothetical protein